MNNKQKIIVTIYTLLVFSLWLYGALQAKCTGYDGWTCAGMVILVLPAIIALFFGIPTFILFKVWSDKKK